MIKLKISHYWLIGLACLFSCKNSTTGKTAETQLRKAAPTPASAENPRPVHWSYTEEGGPDGWAKLSPVYADCGSGKSQSPVDLLSNSGKSSAHLKIEYKTTKLKISHNAHVEELINNGHTIEVTPQEGSTISYEGKVYRLKQFHFHTPSEHTLNGQHFPMEIHLVHQADDKSLAVIGVLVQVGKHNNNFDQLIKYLPNDMGMKKTYNNVNIEIGNNVPKDLYAYHYVGSLTTPPCTENVQWLVMKTPISMNKEQISEFASRLKNNSRPTQPMNGRTVTMDDITANK